MGYLSTVYRRLVPAALFLLAGVPAFGQANVGRISGTVYDSSGGIVPGCKITAVNPQTGLQEAVTSQPTGFYVFPSLAAGTYNLRAEKVGFRTSEQTKLILDAASRLEADFRLEVAGVAQSVTVVAAAERVQSTSGDVSSLITDRQVSQIALNGRNYIQLLQLVPGAVAISVDPFNLALSISAQKINGIRSGSNYTVDGGQNIDIGGESNAVVSPNVDAIAEVKILTASYSAEFGGRAGAMVNVVTKSGTREWHGTLFEFVRNDIFDACSFFAHVCPLRFNDFGWTLGGPVFIPNGWNADKNKLFFFAAQEWKYNHQAATTIDAIPTAQQRAGNFQGSTVLKDPLSGAAFPNNTIPVSRFSPNGKPLLTPYPLPNYTGPGGNFVDVGVNQTDPREDLLKVDYVLSSNTQFTYRWTHDQWNIFNPFQGGNLGIVPGYRPRPGYVTGATLNHVFSPTALNVFTFSFTHNVIVSTPNNQVMKRSVLGLTFPEIYPGNLFAVGPNVNISGITGYNSGDMLRKYTANFQWRDDFTKVLGPHVLKFGAQISRARENIYSATAPDAGTVAFSTSALHSSGNAIADALLGNFYTYNEALAPYIYWARYNQFEFYAQDSWRVSPRLSLEIGLRYNIIPPETVPTGNESQFIPSLFNPANAPQVSRADGSIVSNAANPYNGLALAGSAFPDTGIGRVPGMSDSALRAALQPLFVGLPGGIYQTSYLDLGPRLGFAYDPLGRGKTAIRGGFGMFYDRLNVEEDYALAQNPPFNPTASVYNGSIDNPAGGTSRSFPVSLVAWASQPKTPRTMSFNFGVQQQLPGDVIVEVNYVGTLAHHLFRSININQLPVGTLLTAPNSTANPNALRPYEGYSTITMQDTGDNSNYNSLQVAVHRRVASGLSFGANYTFSKALDTSAGLPQNAYDARPDYGLASISRGQVLNFNYIYDLPFFRGSRNMLVTAMFVGWSLSGVTSFQSGAPVSVTVPVDVAKIGISSSRATVIGDPNLSSGQRTLAHWFNTAAFLPSAQMVQGQFGNSGRDILVGPGFSQWDMSLAKSFRIRDRGRVQFRAESFNIWNHPSFTAVNTTVQFNAAGQPIGGYGGVTASNPGRTLELGLKLLF